MVTWLIDTEHMENNYGCNGASRNPLP